MAPEATPVMLGQEESLARLDQREILEDPDSAILEQEEPRVKEERRATAGLAAAEGIAVRRVGLARKGLREKTVNQGPRVNPASGDQEENLGAKEILAPREILVSLNATS